VRVATLLHAARVLNASDHDLAVRVLDEALALTGRMPEFEREVIRAQAVSLAATVSPERSIRLSESQVNDQSVARMSSALHNMMSHGHAAAAIEYLASMDSTDDYPFRVAREAMGKADEATRLRILRAAI